MSTCHFIKVCKCILSRLWVNFREEMFFNLNSSSLSMTLSILSCVNYLGWLTPNFIFSYWLHFCVGKQLSPSHWIIVASWTKRSITAKVIVVLSNSPSHCSRLTCPVFNFLHWVWTQTGKDVIKSIDWKHLAELGLMAKINQKVLHLLGLTVNRNSETGISEGVLVSDYGEQTKTSLDELQRKPVEPPLLAMIDGSRT